MSDGRPQHGAIPPPQRRLRWQPPESKWAGRALFFALGVAACVATLWLLGNLPRGFPRPSSLWRVAIAMVATAGASAALIIVQRLRHGPRWRWLSYLAGAAGPPALVIVVLVAGPTVRSWAKQQDFDAAAWRAGVEGSGGVRWWMVADLRERHPLEAKTRDEIVALLGPPDAEDAEGAWLLYVLGHGGGFPHQRDPLTMRLDLDRERRVVTVNYFGS